MSTYLSANEMCSCRARITVYADSNTMLLGQLETFRANHQHTQPKEHDMANATVNVDLRTNFIPTLARELRTAANRLQPIDRDELKAIIMSCGENPAAAEVADAVVAHLTAVA